MTDSLARETLRVIDREAPAASLPPSQVLIDAVTQLEANKKDVSPRGFHKRLQLSYAIFDQAAAMVGEIEAQHQKLVADLLGVDRRSPLPQGAARK